MTKNEAIGKIKRIIKGNTTVETDDHPCSTTSRNIILPTVEQDLVDFIEKYWPKER